MKGRGPMISKGEWRLFAMISGFLALGVGIFTALVVLFNNPGNPNGALPTQSPFRNDVASTIPKELFLNDFRFALPGGEWLSQPWLEEQQSDLAWSQKEILPYWTPSNQLKILELPQINDRRMEKLLNEAP